MISLKKSHNSSSSLISSNTSIFFGSKPKNTKLNLQTPLVRGLHLVHRQKNYWITDLVFNFQSSWINMSEKKHHNMTGRNSTWNLSISFIHNSFLNSRNVLNVGPRILVGMDGPSWVGGRSMLSDTRKLFWGIGYCARHVRNEKKAMRVCNVVSRRRIHFSGIIGRSM